MATGNYIPTFHAAFGTLKFATSAVTFDETSSLGSETFANTIIHCKNLTISPPKSDAELVPLLGEETITNLSEGNYPAGGTWQNAIFDEKEWSAGKISGTLILVADDTNIPDFLQLATGAGIAISTTYYRHTFGSSDSGEVRNQAGCIILSLNNGSEECDVVLARPIVNLGDIKPTGADGYFEVDFEAACLPQYFAIDTKK